MRGFTRSQIELMIQALDSHMYWQLSYRRQRRDGYVVWDKFDDNAAELETARELLEQLKGDLLVAETEEGESLSARGPRYGSSRPA